MLTVRTGLLLAAALVTGLTIGAVAQSAGPSQSPTPAPSAGTPADAAEDDLGEPAPGTGPAAGRRGGGALQACRADIQALCAGVERGGGKIVQCIVQNRDKASVECQSALQAAAAGQRGGKQIAGGQGPLAACRTDVATFCGQPGERPGPCLKQNFAKLSPECQSTLMAIRAKRQQVASACQAEGAELCPGQRGPTTLQCLRQNEAKLGANCAAALKDLPQRLGRARAEPARQ